jgi:SAM-dependent methyltransferase
MRVLHEQFLDVIGGSTQEAESILDWPEQSLENLEAWLLALQEGPALPRAALDELGGRGLVDRDHRPTGLGRSLTQALLRRRWQAGDEQFEQFREAASLGRGARVLDVGCSIGQTLSSLACHSPAESVGIDVDLGALALGCRLARRSGQTITFIHGSGYQLPFADHSFTHVICRNSLTYMQHGRALTEISRVLAPGGFIYLRFENVWYDLVALRGTGSAREFICRVRDFALGFANAVTGRQPTPGRRWSGGRAFATTGEVKASLRRLGCQVTQVEESIRCKKILGRATQTSLLARKL